MLSVPILFLAASLYACSQSNQPAEKPVIDECGDIKMPSFPIRGGTTTFDPRVVNLTPSQVKAVGALLINYGAAMCSATLIAPNVVLTAAHCIRGAGIYSISFVGGNDLRQPEFTFSSRGDWHPHPLYTGLVPQDDIGIVIIQGDTAAEGITPIPPNCRPTGRDFLGSVIQTAGYGMTSPDDGWNTRRLWTTLTVTGQTPNYYVAHGYNVTGTCQGDSGGPMLYTMEDGRPYVMGVVSSGNSEDCLGDTYYPRTDYYCDDFIGQFVPIDPCEGETMTGRCEDSVAIWCEGETINREDCAETAKICAPDESGNFRCRIPPDPCEGETLPGRCDGNTAIWCENETVNKIACPEGTLCAAGTDGMHRCLDECNLIGRRGRCDEGARARWCEEGQIKTRDCAACNQTCGWVDDNLGYYCL